MEAWESLIKDLFLDELFQVHKSVQWPDESKPPTRKFRDHFNGILARVQSDIEKGNQSGKEGERSALYELVEQINHEY